MKKLIAGIMLGSLSLSNVGLALEEINDGNAVLKVPVYNSNGDKVGTKDMKAKDVWPKMDQWTDKAEKTYKKEKAGPQVSHGWEWDRELGDNIQTTDIPQDIKQWKNLKEQEKNSKSWRPQKTIEPKKLASTLNRTFGDNSSFGIFQNGQFDTETRSEEVKVNQTFAAGGFVFGKRITLLNQTTKSDSKSKTTRSDIKVFDTSVFVSNDGTVNARKSFTRAKEATKVFVLGIIPVRVKGKVSGTIGADLNYKAEGLSVRGSVAPFVNTRGTASAGVDVLLVVAGIEGTLNFLTNTLKADFAAAVSPFAGDFETSLKVTNNLNLLSGKVSVFAKIRRLFRRDKKFSKSIFSFKGIVQNTTLIDEKLAASL